MLSYKCLHLCVINCSLRKKGRGVFWPFVFIPKFKVLQHKHKSLSQEQLFVLMTHFLASHPCRLMKIGVRGNKDRMAESLLCSSDNNTLQAQCFACMLLLFC